ncbi:DUF2225 domain-containing protein [Lachnobacterium bovis]|jgi:uncharacterized protein (DUF2225 family)|uniref:DUF2225 domain-containing protein n=1 Tax=Lachnobacterium bovis TaxID=140626 RepID=A0A1H9REQ0_9FIRM|nr:DUF2225 domain-containing protein [Lachnobacterium bovis]SER71015.1 hypothetical protein SAMN02910429_00836 [Lachnobacterium bovis]
MNLLSGLEKFGLNSENMKDIFSDENKEKKEEKVKKEEPKEPPKPKKEEPKETDFLLQKAIRCPVCDKVFKTLLVKNGRIKRKESDRDLRPRFMYIDTLKYDIASCPYCGYTAMNRYFEHMSTTQVKLIKEGVCMKFTPVNEIDDQIKEIDYDTAIERYKLALYNAMVKKGKISEKAYTCLKISWLYRAQIENLEADLEKEDCTPEKKASIEQQLDIARTEEMAFYNQAYEGFEKAISSEMYPIAGMDQNTLDFLIAVMAFNLRKYEVASRGVSRLLTSTSATSRIKDKAYDLKEEIISAIRSGK